MSIDIINKIIIPILGAIITYMIVPFIKSKTTREDRQNIYELVKIAVFAAEQMYDAGLINIAKKEYVVEYISSKDIDITIEDLDTMIESAVKELKIADKELKK